MEEFGATRFSAKPAAVTAVHSIDTDGHEIKLWAVVVLNKSCQANHCTDVVHCTWSRVWGHVVCALVRCFFAMCCQLIVRGSVVSLVGNLLRYSYYSVLMLLASLPIVSKVALSVCSAKRIRRFCKQLCSRTGLGMVWL